MIRSHEDTKEYKSSYHYHLRRTKEFYFFTVFLKFVFFPDSKEICHCSPQSPALNNRGYFGEFLYKTSKTISDSVSSVLEYTGQGLKCPPDCKASLRSQERFQIPSAEATESHTSQVKFTQIINSNSLR
jgi:hypothetical protein